jgi:hypothetical protein
MPLMNPICRRTESGRRHPLRKRMSSLSESTAAPARMAGIEKEIHR